MTNDSSEFIVKLSGIKLPEAVESHIANEVRAIVLRELAKLDLGEGITSRFPKGEWKGLLIEKYKGGGPIPSIRTTEINK